jgi:hypothetical protein
MEHPDLNCPRCESPLEYLATYRFGDGGRAMNEWDLYDVGSCPTCSRSFHRNRATGESKAIPWEPQCPECHAPARFQGLDRTLTDPAGDPTGLIYACPQHSTQRWTRDRNGDRWVPLRS